MRLNGLVPCVVSMFLVACSPTATPPSVSTSPSPAAVGPAPQPTSSSVKVKVGTLGIAPEAGLYIAIERGYFNDEGLDIELVPFRSGAEQTAPLATGELHFGAGGPDPSLFNALLRGIDVKIVTHNALVTEGDASAAFIVRADLVESGRFRELADLKGMTIAINIQGTTSQLYVERILEKAGLKLADVTLTIVPFTEMITALANRAVDAAWVVEPFVTIGEVQGVSKSVVPMAEAYPGAITMVVMLSPVFARDQADAARRFVTAHLRGQRDYYRAFLKNEGDREEIVRILTKYTQVKDPRLYANMGWHGVDPNGELNVRVLEDMQEYFVRIGTQQQKVDLNRVIDRSYLNYALERMGRMP
jgi:NitT/TauT family transport system substrate-binding protein